MRFIGDSDSCYYYADYVIKHKILDINHFNLSSFFELIIFCQKDV